MEALARFRPDPALVAGLDEIDDDGGRGDPPVGGVVPIEWLAGRAIGQATLAGEFAAIGRSRSLAYLAGELAAPAARLGVGELDGAAIRMQVPRAFTQLVSRCVYDCRERDGSRQFTGVHYLWRLGDDLANWAVFEAPDAKAATLGAPPSEAIDADDRDLATALERLELTLID